VKGLVLVNYCMASICSMPIQMLMALRTYAPYGGSKAVKRFLIGLFVAEQLLAIALTGVLVALTEYKEFPLRGVSCLLDQNYTPKAAAMGLFAGGAVYEVVVSSMLFTRLYRAVQQGNANLAWIIFNNGE